MKRSRINLQAGDEGDNVFVPVPMVDRGRGDPCNILGVIINRDDNDLYTIAVKQGLLKNKFTRNEFTICQQRLPTNSDVNTDDRISVREALKKGPSGGQGFVRCNCLTSGSKKCSTNKLQCFKSKLKCNSRCYGGLSCKNK